MIKFISYSGCYPALCYGTLTIEVNGTRYELEDCLHSGGDITWDDEGIEDIEDGEWRVSVPDELKAFKEAITEVVNDNVEHGCCGGCV